MSRSVKKTDTDKPWNKRKAGRRPYAIESKQVEKTFLILCEGENTEPEYFKAFPVVTAEIKVVGTGRARTSLVEEAIRMQYSTIKH